MVDKISFMKTLMLINGSQVVCNIIERLNMCEQYIVINIAHTHSPTKYIFFFFLACVDIKKTTLFMINDILFLCPHSD